MTALAGRCAVVTGASRGIGATPITADLTDGNVAYSASKFGLRGLHEVLRAELRGSGVRATLVSPGSVDTALWDVVEAESPPGTYTARSDMLRPEAVAAAVLYAVSQPGDVNVEELRLRRT